MISNSGLNNPNTFFIFFILLWITVLVLISFISGWRELAQYYRYKGQQIDKKRYMQSGTMRWAMGYKSCLTIGANFEGLYFSTFFIFRIGHPPLFIPWSDIKIGKYKFFGFPMLEMTFTRTPSVTLTISQALEDFLQSTTVKPLSFETVEETTKISSARNRYLWFSVVVGTIGLIAALYAMFFIQYRRF